MQKNYYQVLGLDSSATEEDIKNAYRLFVKKFHPDKQNGDKFFEDRFKEVREAYEYLLNPSAYKYTSQERKKTYKDTSIEIENYLLKEKLKKENLLRETLELEIKKLKKEQETAKLQDKLKIKEEEYNTLENTIFLKKGNTVVNGNTITVDKLVIPLKDITNIELITHSNKNKRRFGYFLIVFGLFTLTILIGFVIIYFGYKKASKKDTFELIISKINYQKATITLTEKPFALEIKKATERAILLCRDGHPF